VFTLSKTAHERNPVTVTSPLHPELERILRHHRRESVAQVGPLLLRPDGRQHDEQSFGRWFRKACDKAGLPEQYGVHGLRKTATCALIARGVSDRDIMSILGWKSPDQIKVYGDRYNRVISAIRAHKTWKAAWVTEAAA
jgi:integrase